MSSTFGQDPESRLKCLGWWLHGAGLGVGVAGIALAYVLVFRPLHEEIGDCQARATTVEGLLADAASVRAEHRRLCESISRMEADEATIRSRVPEEPLEAEFLAQLTEAASQAGLKIKDFRPAAPLARDTHSQIEIQFSCAGPYPGLCRFLERLSGLPRLARVERLEVTSGGADATAATITVMIFYGLAKPPQTQGRTETHG